MKEILKTSKSINGILVIHLTANETGSKLFSYEQLIEMEINAADLLNHPEYYGVTDDESKIVRTDFCKPEIHEEC